MPWIDRLVKTLLPKEEGFFDLLERGADTAVKAADVMARLCGTEDLHARSALLTEMRDVEHAADGVIHEVYDALNRTFITPIERSDIYALATHLEDVVDLNHATAMQLEVHAIDRIPEGSVDLAKLSVQASLEVQQAVLKLRGLKHLEGIRGHCETLSRYEHEGDDVYRRQMAHLFRTEQNAVQLIQHKEFLEGLERILDAFDHTGQVLSAIIIKNG
jgi:uncharacterized protein Yka (UPF0111/DUF47 family)